MIDTNEVLVVILGGGQGKRLFPLTKNRAKPAVSFGGKYRLIDIPITNCLQSDLNRIFILTQFNSFSLNRHIWQAYSREVGREGFIDVIAAEQTIARGDWFQGTADAVRQTIQYVLYHQPKYVLVLSGDQVYHMDYSLVLQQHCQWKAQITMAAHYTRPEQIFGLGIVKVSKNMRVTGFCEKPKSEEVVREFTLQDDLPHPHGKPYLGSMGIYLFNTEILLECLRNQETDFGKGIIPQAARNYMMRCYPFEDYWEDVGTIKAFFEANMEWRKGGGISSMFSGGTSIVTHSRQLPPTRIRGTYIKDSLIADGGDIRAQEIHDSIVGVRTRIDSDTIIRNSILMGNSHASNESGFEIGKGCRLSRTICDKNVVIGSGSIITNSKNLQNYDNDRYVIRDGIVVIPPDTTIPPGTVI